MKRHISLLTFVFAASVSLSCSSDRFVSEDEIIQETESNISNEVAELENNIPQNLFKILSLGDSYTVGYGVCETCRFPEQLKQSLISKTDSSKAFELEILARTGWTTTDLLNSMNTTQNLTNNYDLVTLLIGVNNQYQGKPFSAYESEFPQIISKAILFAKSDKNNLMVISIPDYAYTPFGEGNGSISTDINKYNDFAQNYCIMNNITFVNITDISRMGLRDPELIASDGLHPSQLAYSKFVERMVPLAFQKLKL